MLLKSELKTFKTTKLLKIINSADNRRYLGLLKMISIIYYSTSFIILIIFSINELFVRK